MLVAFLCLPLSLGFGQQPIDGGLGHPIQPNQQIGDTDPDASWHFPDTNVRAQIGLASFDEPAPVDAESSSTEPEMLSNLFNADEFTRPEKIGGTVKTILLLATLSLAPAIVLMTTSYIRIVVVLSLLKQAFGAQQLPPTQILTGLALFMTLLVMTPVWNEIKTEAIDPYTAQEQPIEFEEAWNRGVSPVKKFMLNQIAAANNEQAIALFYDYLPDQKLPQNHSPNAPLSAQQIPLNVLLPAFVISELKVAFLLGFQIYLPFLILDLVVSSVTVSTGMLMLPPTMVSFPLKLIMFVLVDGWNLVVGMLLQSFHTYT